MNLLLDRGACASDSGHYPGHRFDSFTGEIPLSDTVLTMAAQWAGFKLTQRLIDGGSDVHTKVTQWTDIRRGDEDLASNITAFFTASRYANINALRVLFDCRGIGVDAMDM
ncbi:hypothetical protein FSARC_14528, partial [Fusarium sarcochroum]